MTRQTVRINNNFVHKFLARCKERCRSEGKVANNVDLITIVSENVDQMSVKMSISAKHFLDICFKDKPLFQALLHSCLGLTLLSLLILVLKLQKDAFSGCMFELLTI